MDRTGRGMDTSQKDKYVYVVRWYDYDNEQTDIMGIYDTWEETLAEIVDGFDGRFDYAKVKVPQIYHKWDKWPISLIDIDGGEYGRQVIIEKVKVG